MPYIGETAGLLTSLFFAANAIVISRAGAQVGSVIVNRTRVIFALLYLLLLNFILFHEPLPLEASSFRWTWLALSGVIGLAIGDAFLIQAYVSIGPRLGTLLLSLSTVFGVLEAWLLFGETLRLSQIIGIALTLSGILWVVLERGLQSPAASRPPDSTPDIVLQSAAPDPIPAPGLRSAPSLLGIFFGIMGALGQATGLVFSRQGMVGNFSPISGNVIRMLAGVLALWLVAILQRKVGGTIRTLKAHPSAVKLLALAAFLGPVLGVSFSLLAVQNTAVGVASVLTSLAPVFMLPFSHFLFKEHLGWQPIVGTLLATAGVVILFIA
ncbi:MAG: DMT family transporter [Anaerolineales bacterium]